MKITKKFLQLFLVLIFTMSIFPAVKTLADTKAVTTYDLNLRAEAAWDAEQIGAIPNGELVSLLDKGEVWSKIDYDGTIGYVPSQYISKWGVVQSERYATSTSEVSLRKAADSDSEVLAVIDEGTTLKVKAVNGDYLKLEADAIVGYSSAKYWKDSNAKAAVKTPPVEPVIETINIIADIKVYPTSYDAAAGTKSTGVYPEGEYFIYKTYIGMINITKNVGTAGGWINPADNKIPSETPASKIQLVVEVKFYDSAEAAADGSNPTGVYPAGEYFMNEISNGMANITGTEGETGKWINLLDNRVAGADEYATPGYENLSYTMVGELRTNASVPLRQEPKTGSKNQVERMPSGSILDNITDTIAAFDPLWYYVSYKDPQNAVWQGYILKTEADVIKTYQDVTYEGITRPTVPANPTGGNGLVVYLDPGHRAVGTGAVAREGKTTIDEVTINWNISEEAKRILVDRGYTVYLSKLGLEDPFDLYDRITEANQLGADIYVSIHCNASSSKNASGTIAFYSSEKLYPATTDWLNSSMLLSQYLAESIGQVMNNKYKVVDDVPYTGGSYAINRLTDMPSSLLELGFLTSKSDSVILANEMKQDELALKIADGIDQYFGIHRELQ